MRPELKQSSKSVRIMSRLIGGLLLLLPFIYLPGFGSYTAMRFFVFGTIALALGVLMTVTWLERKWIPARLIRTLPLYGLLLYLLIFIVVSFTGIDPAFSLFSSFLRTDGAFTLLFLMLLMLGAATVVLLSGEKAVYRFLKYSVIAATLFSVLVTLSPAGFNVLDGPFWERSRGGATIGNSSLAALYVIWNIFFVLLFIKGADKRKYRMGWIAALVVMMTSPLFINWRVLFGKELVEGMASFIGIARGGILGLVVGLLIAVAIWLATDAKRARVYAGRALLVVLITGMGITGGLLLNKSSAVHNTFNEVAGGSRFIFWDSAMQGFAERPWLGWGPNTYSEVYHRHFNPDIFLPGNTSEVLVDKPHNIFFEALAGGGILLTLALIIYLAAMVYLLVRLLKHQRFLGAMCLGAFTAWLIQVQFVFDSVASLILLFFMLGISIALGRETDDSLMRSPRTPLTSRGKWVVVLTGCVAAILFIYTIFLPMWKVHALYRVYDMKLPARAAAWQELPGISPMGDRYDSALVFSSVYDAYVQNEKKIREGDELLKRAALEELDAVNAYLIDLLESASDPYELTLVAAQLHLVRLRIDSQAPVAVWENAHRLATRATELSPTDPRPREILSVLGKAH